MDQTLQPVFRASDLFKVRFRKDRLPKPRRRGGQGVAAVLFPVVSAVAVVAAIGVTCYAALLILRPDLIGRAYRVDAGIADNLKVGVMFFWLELAGIVLGLRLYDEAFTARRQRRQLFDIHASLISAINRILDARYAFAVRLDTAMEKAGAYEEDSFYDMNLAIKNIRHEVLKDLFASTDFTDYARSVVTRFLQVLDRMVGEAYQFGREATRRNKTASREEMDAILNELFECSDPDTSGLGDLNLILNEVRDGR